MPVQLTRHARAMLAERRIEVAWVEPTVEAPEAIEQIESIRTSSIACGAFRSMAIVCCEWSRTALGIRRES